MEASKVRKTISVILPFLCMFALATGSVVLSCATAPMAKEADRKAMISLNTGPTLDGRLYTVWVFDRIRSVMIVDGGDRSRKIELMPKEWRYDPGTTELSILREIPYKDYFASIEGSQALPHAFVLKGIKDETDLLVIVSDRLAIEGYDYAFDAQDSRLTFRDDVSLKGNDWSIQYSTQYGGAMLGEWKPENADRMSYLQAEHRKRWLDSWYDRQTAFYFLDDARMDEWKANPDRSPALIRRAATPKELADMKSAPLSVVKFRTEKNERELSREIGFDARVPMKLGTESPRAEFPLAWKTIEEQSQDGKLVKRLNVVYEDGTGKGLGQYVVNITIEKDDKAAVEPQRIEWQIDEQSLDLGLPVRMVRQWGLQTSDMDAKPTVARLTTCAWTDGSLRFQASGDSENDGRTLALLRQFIAARRKAK
jgi:hypothetical protein